MPTLLDLDYYNLIATKTYSNIHREKEYSGALQMRL